ncbi:hypothetical protein NXY47_00055 [Bacteroides fragilis]|nr:hypothetical protein [Bacteroides fragilis]
MLNENNRPSDSVRITDILANPDVILKIEPFRTAADRCRTEKPELIAHLPFAGERCSYRQSSLQRKVSCS